MPEQTKCKIACLRKYSFLVKVRGVGQSQTAVSKQLLTENGIKVMWGSEYGLSDQYIRLEHLEPSHIEVFVKTVNS